MFPKEDTVFIILRILCKQPFAEKREVNCKNSKGIRNKRILHINIKQVFDS